MTEIWKPIAGYEGIYEVSDRGRVRSLDRVDSIGHRWKGQIIRSHAVSPRGYQGVALYRGEPRAWQPLVHRLVLEAFVGPCPEGMEACHGDGDTTNNAVTNLRWDTPSENSYDTVRHGNHHHARKEACKRGHAYVPENLCGGAAARRGWRRCKACSRELDSARYEAREFDQSRADAFFAQQTKETTP